MNTRSSIFLLVALLSLHRLCMGEEGECGKYARYAYDTVSIRPMDDSDQRGSWKRLEGEGFISTGFPLSGMLATAYDIPLDRIVALPAWASDTRYAITAKMAADDATPVLPSDFTLGTLYQLRLKSLLCDRFMLRAHIEKRSLRAYRLVLKDTEFRMSESTGIRSSLERHSQSLKMRGATMQMIASELSNLLDLPVLDSTKRLGRYNITLTWNEDSAKNNDPIAEEIISELKDVYGLGLVLSKELLDVLVIDSISLPSPN